ncbi:hypothetical protein HL658_25610 [Azospirillum sp. RWY-5-1]|uniref:Uncharacterized protein n=1 Tax=Azospirillum oleiclasticum TaxID=2735135 RepID=A0ABX2THF1_9PROT|nr:hypothetical protein [Azospirillum oleiclasticum]NYZ15932.1 hypothetical protein [Azospirillum oleiclasticum]NYZ23589.1 hypothetical protein [Azospirillum oleiclasticum]
MWNDYVQALIAALALSGLAYGAARAVVHFGERSIEQRHGLVGIRGMMTRRARMEQAFEARHAARAKEVKAFDAELREVVRRRQRLDRQWTDATNAGEQLIRQIGEEVEGAPCWVAHVINRYVGTGNVPRSPILIDRSWSQPQIIEVWVRSMQDARAEVERRYPPSFGFHVQRLNEHGSGDGPAAKAG